MKRLVRNTARIIASAAVVLSGTLGPIPAHAFFGGLGSLGSSFGSMMSSFGSFASGFGGAGLGASFGSLSSGLGSLSQVAGTLGQVASFAGAVTGNAGLASLGSVAGQVGSVSGQAGQFANLGSGAANTIGGLAGGGAGGAAGGMVSAAGNSIAATGGSGGSGSSGGFLSNLGGYAGTAATLGNAALGAAGGSGAGIANAAGAVGGILTANSGSTLGGGSAGSQIGSGFQQMGSFFASGSQIASGINTASGGGAGNILSGGNAVLNGVNRLGATNGSGGGGSGYNNYAPAGFGPTGAAAGAVTSLGMGAYSSGTTGGDPAEEGVGVTDSTNSDTSASGSALRTAVLEGAGGKAANRELSPLDGITGNLVDSAYRDAFMTSMSSPLVLSNIVARLTEPGVAEGANAAWMQASAAWSNRLAAEQLLLKRADTNPQLREAMLDGRWECISRMKNVTAEQAFQACSMSAVTIHNPTTVSPTAPSLNTLGGHAAVIALSGLHPGGTPMWQTMYGTGPTPPAQIQHSGCFGRNCLRLSDLFNQTERALQARIDAYNNFMGPPSPQMTAAHEKITKGLEEVRRVRQEMVTLVGDIEYTVDGQGQTVFSESSYIPPLSGQSPDEYVLSRHRETYETMNELMYGYCEWYDGVCNGTSCSIGYNTPNSLYERLRNRVVDGFSYWESTPEVKTKLATLQTRDSKIQPIVLEQLFALYRKNEHYFESGNDASERCQGFETGSRRPANFDQIRGLVDLGKGTNLKANKVPERMLTVYELSRALAQARWIEKLADMQEQANLAGSLAQNDDATTSRFTRAMSSLFTSAAGLAMRGVASFEAARSAASTMVRTITQDRVTTPANQLTAESGRQTQEAFGNIGEKAQQQGGASAP